VVLDSEVVFSLWVPMLKFAERSVREVLAQADTQAVFFTSEVEQKRRDRNIVAFHEDPKVRVLFASDAGGVGLNLQHTASVCINLDAPWNPAVLEQRIGRIHRHGQSVAINNRPYLVLFSLRDGVQLLMVQKRHELLIAKGWVQAAVLVLLTGILALGALAYRSHAGQPPIPQRVLGEDGGVVFTEADIRAGQKLFLRLGLMEYGSIFGHGAYLGPDFTADTLRRSALAARAFYVAQADPKATERTADDFKRNRYDSATGEITFSDAQRSGFLAARAHYAAYFQAPAPTTGLHLQTILDASNIHALSSFFAWTAWAASTTRPDKDYSYTNNWPPEPLVNNRPTATAIVFSMLSLVTLLGGTGVLLAIFGRWRNLGWEWRATTHLSFRRPGEVHLTPSQRACAWFFLVMAALFLLQVLVGAASQHYRADLSTFFGVDMSRWLPYNLVRTWHVQLSILWVTVSFLAAGIFLVPIIAGPEPRGQHLLAYGLLAALAVVTLGSLAGEFAGIHGLTQSVWWGNQGFEYLDLGRLWQVLLTLGLAAWVALLYRGLRGRLQGEHKGNMPWLFFFSALALPAFYAVGLLAHPSAHFTTTEFWRFWVVHLWVEDFLELFTTVMVAYIFVLLGVVHEKVALRVIYLDIILYSMGGMIGTMHHLYFSGEPVEHMALGAVFSAAEVIPLTFLTLEAWTFLNLAARRPDDGPFLHHWSVMFLMAVGFWNFLGAGIFGFLINLPIVSYYEIGTALTANHAHASMMGVYGMLAAGLALFALRYLIPQERWSDKAAKISFWSLNLGLAWMVFVTLFPLGVLQLYESIEHGYFEARALSFVSSPLNRTLEWLRLPGDLLFIGGGVLPLFWLCWCGVRYRVPFAKSSPPDAHLLFSENETIRQNLA
jgi:nitric oxide reductase subunit B